MKTALKLSQDLINELINQFPKGNYVDATLGNGHDIYRIVSHPNFQGHVYGFDIQSQALANTGERLQDINSSSYTLIQDSHAHIGQHLPSELELAGAIFNLGYLPGGDKSITTQFASTQAALEWISEHLQKGGRIILVVYHGHPEGKEEAVQLEKYLAQYTQEEFQVAKFEFMNQINEPPYLLIIERK